MGATNARAPVLGARNDEIGNPATPGAASSSSQGSRRRVMSDFERPAGERQKRNAAANLLSLQILEKFRGGFHPAHKKMVSRTSAGYIEQVPLARINLFQIGVVT